MSVHRVQQVMGTTISMDLVDTHDTTLADRLEAWFTHVDHTFSPYREDSPITRLGRGELGDHELTDEILSVLEGCEQLCADSDGVFDVWNLPSPNGTRFDPCGYVKGWSVQRAADLLVEEGVQDFCLNAGGDIALRGRNHKGEVWSVGVRHPHDAGLVALVLHGEGPLAVATSGTYERGAHIVDPRTGDAVTDLASVTVVGPDLTAADAYATTVFAMGMDGLTWLAAHDGYECAAITHDLRLVSTPGLGAYR